MASENTQICIQQIIGNEHGKLVRDGRIAKGLKAVELATALKVTGAYISRVENGLDFLQDEKLILASAILDIHWVNLWKSTGRTQITLSTLDISESRKKFEELESALLKEAA